jgi:hypothetical protein
MAVMCPNQKIFFGGQVFKDMPPFQRLNNA